MSVWKFIVHNHKWTHDPDQPHLQYQGCLACAIAETEAAARAHIERYAAENGLDARWLRVAEVRKLPIQDGVVAAWAQL